MSSSVVRALRILELLAESEKPLTLARIAEKLQIPKSTAHSILRDLTGEAFVDLVEPTAYVIGLKAFEVGAAHLRLTTAVEVVRPELARLTRALDVTSHYAILDHTDAVYLCKEDPPGLGVRLASSIGARLPSHLTAVGKACLAWVEPDEVPEHVLLQSAGLRSGKLEMDDLVADLALVRERGYATDDGESASGVQCVASPVFDMNGPRGAIGVSYLGGAGSSPAEIAEHVVASAARASTMLGGKSSR